MSANSDDTGGYEYQSTFEGAGSMEWELQAHDKKQLEKKYCMQCSRSVGDDPAFFGVGGFLTGPFCGRSCQFAWLNEGDDE